ncbi:MAG: hypothetical protein ACYSUQ_11665, partial [Planctomycetota bacterium]
MQEMLDQAMDWLGEHQLVAQLLASLFLLILAYLADKIAKWVLLKAVHRIVKGTAVTWDDVLLKYRTFQRLAHLAPVLAIHYGIRLIPGLPEAFVNLVQH